ncbi:MAG: siderophore-interacting protein [Aquamicrobium sp.]|nr:siderophore-interacting protein [Aquamicrobium sp.]
MLGPGGGSVAPAARYLLAGDETALPAIARLLETLPAQARGLALIEVADVAEEQAIANRTAIEVRWLHRDGAAPGTTTLLPDAITALPAPAQGDDLFVWASCEFCAFKAIRAHVRKQWKLAKENHLVTSYWRRGSSEDTAGRLDAETDAAATVGRRLGLDVE